MNKAIELNPNASSSYYNKGQCLYKLKRLEEAIESFDVMFDELCKIKLDIAAMQKVINAVCHIDGILETIGVNLFSYELELLALKAKCKGLILLEEYEEVSEINLRLGELNASLKVGFEFLMEAS